MRIGRYIVLITVCSFALIAKAQEARTARITLAGDVHSFDAMSQLVDKKNHSGIVFGTATNEFPVPQQSTDQTAYVLSLSSSKIAMGKYDMFVKELEERHIHQAGLKDHGDFMTFTQGGMRFGFASFGSTPMSLMRRDSVIVKTIISRLKFKTNIVAVAYSYDTNAALRKSTDGYIADVRYFSHLCIDAGADVVFVSGCKSHMPLELYGDRLIIYGQEGCPIEAVMSDDGTFISGLFLRNGNGTAEMTKQYFPETHLSFDHRTFTKSSTSQAQGIVHNLLAEASKYRGRRYKIGAMGPNQFDCSGFTGYIFKLMGFSLPRTAEEQSKTGRSVRRNELQPGDLVFFKRPATRRAGHVGIVYSVDEETGDFTFIHASTTRGVVIDNFSHYGYFVKRYMGARRVIEKKPTEFTPIADGIVGIENGNIHNKQAQ